MPREEKAVFTNMCMVTDNMGNVLVLDRQNPDWPGLTFPGGHVEPGESFTESVIREVWEETGLTIENPRLCGIKEFHKRKDGTRYIVFLYTADRFSGELKASGEGDIFWYPLEALAGSGKLIDGFGEMLSVFTQSHISEVYYEGTADGLKTVYW